NRAGEITYRQISQLTFEATVTTYTKTSGPSLNADRDSLEIDWGDGTSSFVARVNGTPGGTNNVPQGEMIADDIKMNKYVATHTYPGPLPFYVISMTDPNRNDGIVNVNNGNSVNILFYLEDTIRVLDPTFVGYNSSPVLLNPPIDNANINEIFYHNPAAYDPDGDSLSYELIPSKATPDFNVPLYQYPDEVSPGIDNNFTIDARTGLITWDVPKAPTGEYNVAILIREYRNGIQLGSILRDMQITVRDNQNKPPIIEDINDTCIIAGNNLRINVNASDPDPGQTVTLTAFGGPLEFSNNPASFQSTPAIGSTNGFFEWQTTCDDIRRQFYQIVFRAEDNFSNPSLGGSASLTDTETWLIRVIAPPPENLQAEAINNTVELEWQNPYRCNESATDKFLGFTVWRRLGSNPFQPDTCEPGLAGRGYTKISQLQQDYNYVDSNVKKGHLYCYRVLAEFAEQTPFGFLYNRVESLPSNEACSELRKDVPLLTNVSVDVTDEQAGEMFVAWTKPIPNADNLDTVQFPGPYEFRLLRSDGFNAPTQQIATFSSPTFGGLNDTSYQDNNLNTVEQPYTYQVDFYANNGVFVGSSEPASSIFLDLAATDREIEVLWEEDVPWINEQYVVFRQNPNSGLFEQIGDTITEQSYIDNGLINDSLYCYKVLGLGYYTGTNMPSPLINFSQEKCARPLDTIPPCAPILEVKNNCRELNEGEGCEVQNIVFINELTWTLPCDEEVKQFNIYFSSPFEDNYSLVERVIGSDSTYRHELGESVAGCYVITATDSAGNESELSNEFCVDNCPCYKLPNVFTPNGDGQNDLFTPFLPYRFVDRVDMRIFNRLGGLIFKTENPDILWDGTNQQNGNEMPEGVYYYTCKVYEVRVEGIVQSKDVLSGYIHLIRSK
ncbi:MAG: gliding motility-associated C-terminal domain-containing protein, partial [Chitinophagales bacterium]